MLVCEVKIVITRHVMDVPPLPSLPPAPKGRVEWGWGKGRGTGKGKEAGGREKRVGKREVKGGREGVEGREG